MADESENKSPRPAIHESELLPAMLAIALAVAAQLALVDGLTLLGLAGFIVAAWLFVTSVRAIFDAPPRARKPGQEEAPAGTEVESAAATGGSSNFNYLRRHWRLVTIAEILTGDIPPVRLAELEIDRERAEELESVLPVAEASEVSVEPPVDAPLPETEAQMASWTPPDAPRAAPKAVKVTPQGEVLVLDTGLEQVQRYSDRGDLLATYSLAGLAAVDVLDLDVSPDGQTLYIVDAASNRLQVITLAGVDPASGQAGGGSESE